MVLSELREVVFVRLGLTRIRRKALTKSGLHWLESSKLVGPTDHGPRTTKKSVAIAVLVRIPYDTILIQNGTL